LDSPLAMSGHFRLLKLALCSAGKCQGMKFVGEPRAVAAALPAVFPLVSAVSLSHFPAFSNLISMIIPARRPAVRVAHADS